MQDSCRGGHGSPPRRFLPAQQKRLQRLVHFVEGFCTKQERLKVSWIVNVVCCCFDIEGPQFGLVHLGQFSC